jgi:hypothetical protein
MYVQDRFLYLIVARYSVGKTVLGEAMRLAKSWPMGHTKLSLPIHKWSSNVTNFFSCAHFSQCSTQPRFRKRVHSCSCKHVPVRSLVLVLDREDVKHLMDDRGLHEKQKVIS